LPFIFGAQVNAPVACTRTHYSAQEVTDAASSGSMEVNQTVDRSLQENLTRTIQGGGQGKYQTLQFSSISNSASFIQHIMCKDYEPYWNGSALKYKPIEPTTIFRPSDTKAVCLTTVSINKTIEFRWYYRNDSSKTWVSCYNYSMLALFPGKYQEYCYEGHLNIAGCWLYYPRAYKVDVHLDGSPSPSFSEFFEITNGGLNSPRMCENVVNGNPVNIKSRFTIGNDTKVYHYSRFDNIAYFNDEYCHNFTTVWIQPNGSTYKTYSGSFPDYKDTNATWNYWDCRYTPDDYISINSSTPVGNWKAEVYLDSYFNSTWMPYGPVATTPFIVGNQTVKDWTFMVYLDADNTLENASIPVFSEMASVGSTPQVNIVVQWDRIPGEDSSYGNWTDCKRFYVTKGMTPTPENQTQDLGEANMGDPNTLKDFVNWTINNYPASYYFLVLWDHGTGCMGLCFDITNSSDFLSLPELSKALSGLPAIMDVVLLDACSMSMTEVAYQLKDCANVLVGPEGFGYEPAPYDYYLTSLTSNSSMSPSAFAEQVVTLYINWCKTISDAYIPDATMAATDLTRITRSIAAIDDFALKLNENENFYDYLINLARNQTEGYTGPIANDTGYYIDLYHFAQLTSQKVLNEELKNTADQVMTALESIIILEANKLRPNSHGLSIFFPNEEAKYNYYKSLYEETTFAENTPWDEFLKYYLDIQKRGYLLTIQTSPSDIPVKVKIDDESYATDNEGKIQLIILDGSYNVTVPATFLIGPSSRRVFIQWDDSDRSNPRTLPIHTTLTLEAQYDTQHRLIMDTKIGTTNPSIGEGWYKAGSTVEISAKAPDVISGERYVWLGWTGKGLGSSSSTNNPAYITMNAPINETGTWRHEYYLTVTSLYGSPTLASGWFEAGEEITPSITSPWPGPTGVQYICTKWTGTGSVSPSGTTTTVPLTLNAPSSITWNWKTQYLLTVRTDPTGLNPQPNISSPGPWYDNGTVVNCTAQKISGYVFDHWTVDGESWDRGVNPITVTVDGPYEAIAHYVHASTWWENLSRPEMLQVILGITGVAFTVTFVGAAWVTIRRSARARKAAEERAAVALEKAEEKKYKLVYKDLLKEYPRVQKRECRVGVAQIGVSKTGDILSELYEEKTEGLFSLRKDKVETVRSNVKNMIETAHEKGVNILLFPELAVDFNYSQILEDISSLAKAYEMYIIPGSYDDQETKRNISVVVGPDGILWRQEKHIPAIMSYGGKKIKEGIDVGTTPRKTIVCNTEFGRIAIAICRDFLDMDLRVELKNFEPPVDLIFNPAFTTVTEDFKAAHFDARRSIYAYCFFANVAEFGDSLIYTPEKERVERRIPPGEESLIYKDIDLFKLCSERRKWEKEKEKTFIQSTR
jgi:predicted amidohydrolase